VGPWLGLGKRLAAHCDKFSVMQHPTAGLLFKCFPYVLTMPVPVVPQVHCSSSSSHGSAPSFKYLDVVCRCAAVLQCAGV
jgi:hypothetical protein